MIKKSATAGKRKTSGSAAQLQKLKDSIKRDVAELAKGYAKALAEMGKNIRQHLQDVKKAKRKPKATKGAKGAKAAKAKVVNLVALKKGLDRLKADKTALQSEARKFAALHKLVTKGPAKKSKKTKTASKPKKAAASKSKKKAAPKKAATA